MIQNYLEKLSHLISQRTKRTLKSLFLTHQMPEGRRHTGWAKSIPNILGNGVKVEEKYF